MSAGGLRKELTTYKPSKSPGQDTFTTGLLSFFLKQGTPLLVHRNLSPLFLLTSRARVYNKRLCGERHSFTNTFLLVVCFLAAKILSRLRRLTNITIRGFFLSFRFVGNPMASFNVPSFNGYTKLMKK